MATTTSSEHGIRALVAAVGQGPTNGRYLTREEARFALEAIMDGVATPAQAGGLLLLQRYRSEAPEELAGYVDAARSRMFPFAPAVEGMLDIGSPYDGRAKHIVISPAASVVAAAAGVPVLMHGEPGMGPKAGLPVGSVIEALGVETNASPDVVSQGIASCGLGYIRQARLAPAFAALMPLRAELGLRSPLHMVEKIYSPGSAPYHLIGVAHMPYLNHLAPALSQLGFQRTMVVQGIEGHEDVTTSRGARVVEIDEDGVQTEWRLDPSALGLEPASEDDLAPGDAERSARMTLSVLDGSATAAQVDLVVVNAALRIKLAGRAPDLASALACAHDAIASGAARQKLDAWRRVGRPD